MPHMRSSQQCLNQRRIDPIPIHTATLNHRVVLVGRRQSLDVPTRCCAQYLVITKHNKASVVYRHRIVACQGGVRVRIEQRFETIVSHVGLMGERIHGSGETIVRAAVVVGREINGRRLGVGLLQSGSNSIAAKRYRTQCRRGLICRWQVRAERCGRICVAIATYSMRC